MTKNIIILSDGTGNGSAKSHKTNVWRLYDALDLHRDDQIAYYDDGVGAQEFLPLKILGGVFGWGLKRNVLELYQFLCRTYKAGDRIYLFGFSRGAFTVRMLAGLLDECGVYTDYADDRELERVCRVNYNSTFKKFFRRGLLTRFFRDALFKEGPVPPQYKPDIEFIGVWDTVDAYGLPIDQLANLWDLLIYPIYFPDYSLSAKVKKACHALSVDDERLTFNPLLWTEEGETDPSRIEQVWFPGVHADVGGGYPEHTLSLVTLDWMISRAEPISAAPGSTGLHLIEQRRDEIFRHADWHGPKHDSRALVGAYYRYSPRDIARLCDTDDKKKNIKIPRPKIHRSVFERIGQNATPYAPAGLPEEYEVVVTRGTVPCYETQEEAGQRKVAMQAVHGVITIRKCLYFMFLTTSIWFFLTPQFLDCWSTGTCPPANGLLDPLLKLAMRILPDFSAPWVNVLRNYPMILYGLIVLFGAYAIIKAKALEKTQFLAVKAWAALKNKGRRG